MDESNSAFQSQVMKRIYEESPEGILVVDEKNIIISHNHQFVEIWQIQQTLKNLGSDSFVGFHNSTILSTILDKLKDKHSFLARIKELYENPQLQDVCEIELLDGRTLERNSSIISDNNGRYIGRVWFLRDITYRKHIEAELRSNQERLELAINSEQIGIWELNLQTKELIWDDTMLALYRINRSDFSSTYDAWLTRLHPEDRPHQENALQTVINQTNECHLAFRAITPDGEITNIKGHAKVVKDANGNPVSVIGTQWNNNAYVNAQQELQLAYSAINFSNSAYFWIDPTGDIFAANEFACASLGYSREELIGKPCWFIDPSLNQEAWFNIWNALKQQKKIQHESTLLDRSGNLIPVEIICNHSCIGDKEYCFSFAIDITDRKQNEEALKIESDKNATLLRNASDGIHILDYDGNLLEASDSFCKMLGYTRTEIIGMNVNQWDAALSTPEELLSQVRQQITSHLRSQFETRHRRKDGTIFDVEVSGYAVELNNNRVLFNSSRDITERKQTEKILKEREYYQRALLDGFPFMVWLKDEKSRFLAVNQAFADACNLSCPSELEGKTDFDYWSQDLASAYQEDDRAVLRSGNSKNIEELIEINGERIWFETYKSPIKINDKIIGTVGSARNITERKLNELALKKESEKNATLLHNASDGIHIIDTNGYLLEASHSFCKNLGYSYQEMIGMHVAQWNDSFIGQDASEVLRRDFARQESIQIETVHKHRNGSLIDVEINIVPMLLEEKKLLFCSSRNITERKLAEKAIEFAAKEKQLLLDSTGEGIFGLDIIGRCTFVNKAATQLLGYQLSELLGQEILKIIQHSHSDGSFYAPSQSEIYQTLKSGSATQSENEVFWHKNDSCFPVEFSAHPIIDADINYGAVIVFTDISKRKQTEKALTDSHNLLQTIINSVPLRVFWKDKQFRYLGCNPLFALDSGMNSPEDLVGKDDFQMGWKDQAELYRMDDRLVMESGIPKIAFDEPQTTPDGDQIWLRTSKVPLFNDAKQTIGILGIYEDITQHKLMEQALKESELIMQAILDNSPFFVWLKDTEGRYLKINRAFADLITLQDPKQIVGKTDFDLWPKKLAEQYQADDEIVLLTQRRKHIESEALFDGHQSYWIETYKTPVIDSENNILGTVGFSHDITERKKSELELRIAATAFESQEGMMVCDADNNILRVNNAFTKITGYCLDDVVGKNPSILKSDRQDEQYYIALWNQIKTNGSWEGDIWNKRKNGEVYPVHLIITAIKDNTDTITHYVATITDITQSKAATAEIERLAFYDSLTGLPNRRLLIDRLQQALAASGRNNQNGALLFIDLDNFKNLNDALGHDIGDLLLQQVATRLSSCVRGSDTVARLGGDEFVVLLEYLGEQTLEAATQVEAIGKKILYAINQPYQLVNQAHITSASIGVTLFDQRHASLEDLLKHADIAMYQSKKAGRNTLRFFDPQMQANLNTRLTLETDLRFALSEHQFQLYYQPQVSHIGHFIGAEALIRWHHPKRGIVSPIEFISVAEEANLILLLGDWIIETACQQLKNWGKNIQTRQLQLAVNVSARQFRQSNFTIKIAQILESTGINPENLKLELTESLFLDDIDDTIATMISLRELGVQFSMDDFGTGYSSLSNLKKLPIQQLKIDQSFVRDITTDSDDAIIVQTIIAMAKNLQIEVIAEGVETEAQRSFLEQHDCLLYQGFLYSEPLPIEQFESLLQLDPFNS